MEIVANIGQVIAACWAIISGVGAWKREFIGKRKNQLAEDVLATFFEAKDSIAFIRNPFTGTNEGNSRKQVESEDPETSQLLNRGYIVYERYEKEKEVFIKFRTLKYRFMASFGSETESMFYDFDKTLNSIFISAKMLATHYWQRQGRVQMSDDKFKKHLEEMNQHEGVF